MAEEGRCDKGIGEELSKWLQMGTRLYRICCKLGHNARTYPEISRLATVQSSPVRGLFWRLLKRLDCTVQSFVGLDWTVPKDRTVRRQ